MVNLSDTDANNCVVDSIQFNKNRNYLALALALALAMARRQAPWLYCHFIYFLLRIAKCFLPKENVLNHFFLASLYCIYLFLKHITVALHASLRPFTPIPSMNKPIEIFYRWYI
jgi:hypothetical protein